MSTYPGPVILSSIDPQGMILEQRCIRTLVVDDSPSSMRAVCALMQAEPLVEIVGVATNGVEAIAAVATLSPDLVIMDVNLPLLDGLKAASILSRHYPEIRVVLMSADDSAEIRRQGVLHGADAVVLKSEIVHGLHTALLELYSSLYDQA